MGKTHNSGSPPHNFTKRTKQVISQLNNNKDENIISLLKNAIKLSKKRNTIVHNPMHLQVYQHNVTKELYPEFAIMSFVGNDYVDLPDLTEITAEVTDTMTQLYMTLGYLPIEDKVANKRL